MVDPIISTGLATGWLERLHKLWSTLRRTRAGELQEIQNLFGDPKLLADYYIEPDCQPVNPADHDEDESIRAFRQPVRVWLNRFLEGEFFERDGRNTVFVLSDAGMGKTSLLMMLKLTHLMKFWPSGLDFCLMKLGPDTLEKLAKIQNQTKTVLLLDSLDEDSSAWGRIEDRLMELLDATKSFRQVILTCRTQFFPEGSAAPIEAPYKVVVGGYICNLLYLSPFDNAQVEAYLRNVYPNHFQDLLRKWWKKEDNPKLMRARKVVEPMKSLRMRPMLLAHIDDLMQADVHEWREFAVYEVLVRRWLLREQRKQQGRYTEDQLWELCEEVAIYLQTSGKRVLSLEDLEAIRKTLPVAETLKAFDIGGRSLLNRTSDKGFRFSHYSIQEFLVARRLAGRMLVARAPLRATDQLLTFLFSWIDESPVDRLSKVPWLAMDLHGIRSPSGIFIQPIPLDLAVFYNEYRNSMFTRPIFFAEDIDKVIGLSAMPRLGVEELNARQMSALSICWLEMRVTKNYIFNQRPIKALRWLPGLGLIMAQGEMVEVWTAAGLSHETQVLELRSQSWFRGEVTSIQMDGHVFGGELKPDGSIIAFSRNDGTVGILHRLTKKVRTFRGGSAPVAKLVWHSTLPLLVVISEDGLVEAIEVNLGEKFMFFDGMPLAALALCSPEGVWALLGRSGRVYLFDTLDIVSHSLGKSENPLFGLPVRASAMAWGPAGNLLALAVLQTGIEIWEVGGGIPKLRLSLFDAPPVRGLVITADGYVDGPPEALKAVRFADGEALYDLDDLPERHDPERVRQAMSILSS